jgi:hypothetical protein
MNGRASGKHMGSVVMPAAVKRRTGADFVARHSPAPLRVTVARHIPGCASHFATRRPAKPLKPAEQQGRRLLNGRQCPFSRPISICSPRLTPRAASLCFG